MNIFNASCRSCLQISNSFVSLDYISTKNEKTIREMINFSSGVNIPDDNYSQFVCLICAKQIILAYNVKKTLLESEIKIKMKRENQRILCNAPDSSVESRFVNLEKETPEPESEVPTFNNPIIRITRIDEELHIVNNTYHIDELLVDERRRDSGQQQQPNKPQPKKIFTCQYCHRNYKQNHSLKIHELCHSTTVRRSTRLAAKKLKNLSRSR